MFPTLKKKLKKKCVEKKQTLTYCAVVGVFSACIFILCIYICSRLFEKNAWKKKDTLKY